VSTQVTNPTQDQQASSRQEPDAPRAESRLASRLFIAALAAAMLPIAVAAVRALVRHWIPLSDDAFFVVRAHDVFDQHRPLLGLWSSASLTAGSNLNHPGPLLFDALAVPVRLFGGSAGVVIGIACVNALAVAGVAWFAYRRGGALVGAAAVTVTAVLCWTLGSEVLFEPWQPYSMLLPFLFFLVLVWSIMCGDLLALPFAAGVGSLILQTHLSYSLLVPVLAVGALGGLVLVLVSDRRRAPDAWPARRRGAVRAGAIAGAVAVICWVQPIVEEFTSDGPGNLTRLWRSFGSTPSDTVGFSLAAKLTTSVIALPPWWLRPSFRDAWVKGAIFAPPADVDVPSGLLTLTALVVLFGVLAWWAWRARRAHDRTTLTAVITAVLAVGAGVATAARIPLRPFGIAAHQFRFIWPIGAFVGLALLLGLCRLLTAGRGRESLVVGGLAAITLAVAVWNIPTSHQTPTTSFYEPSIPIARALDRQMGSLEGKGPLLVDDLFHHGLGNPFDATVLAELQRRDVPFVAKDAMLVRQLGPQRRFTGKNARAVLLLGIGAGAKNPPAGARRVAFVASDRGDVALYLAPLDGSSKR
jgi:hypothetical protein